MDIDKKEIHKLRLKTKYDLEWLKGYTENILEDNSGEELLDLFRSVDVNIKKYTLEIEIYYLIFAEITFFGLINNKFKRKSMEENLDAIAEGAEFIQHKTSDMCMIIIYLILLAFYLGYYCKDIAQTENTINEYEDIVSGFKDINDMEYIALFRKCIQDDDYDTVLNAFKWKMKAMFQLRVDNLINSLERSNKLRDGVIQKMEGSRLETQKEE